MEIDPAGGHDLAVKLDDLGPGGRRDQATDSGDQAPFEQEIATLVATAGRIEDTPTAQEYVAPHLHPRIPRAQRGGRAKKKPLGP